MCRRWFVIWFSTKRCSKHAYTEVDEIIEVCKRAYTEVDEINAAIDKLTADIASNEAAIAELDKTTKEATEVTCFWLIFAMVLRYAYR